MLRAPRCRTRPAPCSLERIGLTGDPRPDAASLDRATISQQHGVHTRAPLSCRQARVARRPSSRVVVRDMHVLLRGDPASVSRTRAPFRRPDDATDGSR